MDIIKYTKKEENSLLYSIIFLIFGVILFTNPGGILKFVSYITGAVLIIIGICNILNYRKTLKNLNIELKGKLITGIVLIILGLITTIIVSFIETTIRLIISAWIIYNGIIKLINALANKDTTFIPCLIIAIAIILCGLFIALEKNLVFKFIGLFIMIYCALDISNYIIKKGRN